MKKSNRPFRTALPLVGFLLGFVVDGLEIFGTNLTILGESSFFAFPIIGFLLGWGIELFLMKNKK